jgi:hypothetical protein
MKLIIRVLHIYYLACRLPISGPQGTLRQQKALAIAGEHQRKRSKKLIIVLIVIKLIKKVISI